MCCQLWTMYMTLSLGKYLFVCNLGTCSGYVLDRLHSNYASWSCSSCLMCIRRVSTASFVHSEPQLFPRRCGGWHTGNSNESMPMIFNTTPNEGPEHELRISKGKPQSKKLCHVVNIIQKGGSSSASLHTSYIVSPS